MSEVISRRGFLGATVALGGGALLAGCSSGSGGSSGGASGGGASGDVVYNTFLDPANTSDPRAVAQTAAIAAFEKANPNIKIRVNVDPSGGNVSKAIASRSSSPDVWRVTNFTVQQYVKQGGLAPLDSFIDRDGMDRNDWLLPLSFNQVQGKTYCLNQDYRIPVFLYRADAFKAIGVTAPPTTFDEVLRIAKDFSSAGKLFFPAGMGAAGGVFPGQAFLEFLGASMIVQKSDGAYFAADGREPAFSKAAVESCATVVKELYSSKASTPAALNWGYTEVQQALQTGTASSSTFGLYRFNTLKASGAADLAWAPPPAYEAGGKQVIQGQALSINNASQKKDAAWEFVKFMTSPETQAGLARGGEVVSRKSAYTNSYFSQPEAANLVAWKDLVQQRGQSVSYSVNYAAFGEVVSNALSAMILQNGSPSTAADEIMSNYADKIKG